MNSNDTNIRNQWGFSLLEVILIITLSAVASTMMFKYFGTFITDSAIPIHRLTQAMELKQSAEHITAYYKQDPTADLNLLKTSLESGPQVYGQNFTVVYNGFVKFVSQNDVGISAGDTQDLLKVKIIQNDTHEAITLLFARE